MCLSPTQSPRLKREISQRKSGIISPEREGPHAEQGINTSPPDQYLLDFLLDFYTLTQQLYLKYRCAQRFNFKDAYHSIVYRI